MDYFIIVGRINEIINVSQNQVDLIVAISYRSSQSNDTTSRTVRVNVFNTIADKVRQYCKFKDLISIKGYIDLNEDNQNILVAEQVAFMQTEKPRER